MTPRVLIRGLILIATLAAVGFLFKAVHVGSLMDQAWIDADVRGQGLAGEILFVAAAALFTGIGLPRQLVAFLGGYAFGLTMGTALALLATALGCIAAFYYARLLGRDFVAAKFPSRVRKIDDFLSDHPLTMTLLIRLLPAGSNFATNLIAGVSRVRGLPFFAGSAIGYIPQTLVFALIGSGISVDPVLRISLSVALFLVSGVLGVHLYRRHRQGKTLDETIDQALDGPAESPATSRGDAG